VHSKHNYLKNVKIKGKRKEIMTKKTKDIPKKNIQYKLHKSITKASDELGVSETKLKKECRKNGIKRWPSRKISMVMNFMILLEEIAEKEEEETSKKMLYAQSDKLREELRSTFYD
tara:strand:+ start:1273 stop:1620 length:348 start_codon:yes stop_codon:yes gene_type:complete